MEATKARGRELTVAIRAAVARAMVEIKPASAQAPTGQIPMDVQLVPKVNPMARFALLSIVLSRNSGCIVIDSQCTYQVYLLA